MTTTALKNSITFNLQNDQAVAIVKRAASALQLPTHTWPDGTFRVELNDPIDAYYLGDLCAKDPAWAGLFVRRG